jgi:hypothetical protein
VAGKGPAHGGTGQRPAGIHSAAFRVIRDAVWAVSCMGIALAFGMAVWPRDMPIIDAFRERPWAVPTAIALAWGMASLIGLVLLRRHLASRRRQMPDTAVVVWALAALSTSATAVILLATAAAYHAPWCPGFVCPPPAPPRAYGQHDGNLEIRFHAFEAQAFVLPSGTSSVALGQVPRDDDASATVAQHLSDDAPYGVALHLRDISSSQSPLIIENVDLHVVKVGAVADPLPVWAPGRHIAYRINAYDATYAGEVARSVLSAKFDTAQPGTGVELQQGESDDIVVRLHSKVSVDLWYTIAVEYLDTRSGQTSSVATLAPFHVAFAGDDSWLPTPLQDGGGSNLVGSGAD